MGFVDYFLNVRKIQKDWKNQMNVFYIEKQKMLEELQIRLENAFRNDNSHTKILTE